VVSFSGTSRRRKLAGDLLEGLVLRLRDEEVEEQQEEEKQHDEYDERVLLQPRLHDTRTHYKLQLMPHFIYIRKVGKGAVPLRSVGGVLISLSVAAGWINHKVYDASVVF